MQTNRGTHSSWWIVLVVTGLVSTLLAGDGGVAAPAYKPEGEMRYALYVTISPAWFDPAEVATVGLTPFWFCYALHDALLRPMPDNPMAPNLAESWTVSDDQRVYEFTLRQGLKFHNGDAFTAEDVKFSFLRYKSKILHEKIREVEIVDPLPGALPSASALARFHDLLRHHDHGSRLDRPEAIYGAGGG